MSASEIAKLADEIERYGINKLNGKDDTAERDRLASEIVKMQESLMAESSISGDTPDSVEDMKKYLQFETKNVLKYVESAGLDKFDDERAELLK